MQTTFDQIREQLIGEQIKGNDKHGCCDLEDLSTVGRFFTSRQTKKLTVDQGKRLKALVCLIIELDEQIDLIMDS